MSSKVLWHEPGILHSVLERFTGTRMSCYDVTWWRISVNFLMNMRHFLSLSLCEYVMSGTKTTIFEIWSLHTAPSFQLLLMVRSSLEFHEFVVWSYNNTSIMVLIENKNCTNAMPKYVCWWSPWKVCLHRKWYSRMEVSEESRVFSAHKSHRKSYNANRGHKSQKKS